MRTELNYAPQLGNEAFVAPGVACGQGVSVGARSVVREGAVLYDHVTVGEDCVIGPHVVLGEPERDYYHNPNYTFPPCHIGDRTVVRVGTVVYTHVTIGADCETGSHVSIREDVIVGHHTRIGTYSDIQAECTIGNYVSLHSNVTVGALSVIEDYAWLMPLCVLINDWYPPTCLKYEGPVVGQYAVVGARTTVYPGVQIGESAVIAADSVVKESVPEHTLVGGVPATPLGDARKLVTLVNDQPVTPYPWPRHRAQGYPWDASGDAAGTGAASDA